jgi:hypothetical protein
VTSSIPASENGTPPKPDKPSVVVQRTLVWLGIASASAAVTYLLIRASMRRAPVDPTSERIQSLIDEANRLLRTLDDKKHG